jgi:hypothetical protein
MSLNRIRKQMLDDNVQQDLNKIPEIMTQLSEKASKEEVDNLLVGQESDILLKPPNNTAIQTYATSVSDSYFHSLQAASTPANSISPEKNITLSSTGYFFYRFKAVNNLKPGNKFSFFVETPEKSNATKVEYRFLTAGLSQIGSIYKIPTQDGKVYIKEGIAIPSNAEVVEIRLDNRGSLGQAVFYNPVLIPSEYIGLSDPRKDASVQAQVNEVKTLISKKGNIPVLTPVNFGWQNHELSGRIFTDGKGGFHTDFDVAERVQSLGGIDYYVDGINGLDTNAGTKISPFKNIRTALAKTDVGTIWLKGGQSYNRASINGMITKNINIRAYEGVPVLGWYDSLTYTLSSGQTKTYQANRSAVQRVIDLKFSDGEDELEYTKKTSVAEVEASAGSWYTDGTILYIHTKDDRQPDSNILPFLSGGNLKIALDVTYVYLEGIKIYGGDNPVQYNSSSTQAEILLKDCHLKFAGVDNGLEAIGAKLYIAQNCIAARNPMDGFNYHASGTAIPNFIEIDCIGRNNGNVSGSDNGTTAHDGVKGIRLRGMYYRNNGGNVADVGANTETWNLGCTAFESLQTSDFLITNGAAKMWLDHCKGYGSTNALDVGDATASVYVRSGEFPTENLAGTKNQY